MFLSVGGASSSLSAAMAGGGISRRKPQKREANKRKSNSVYDGHTRTHSSAAAAAAAGRAKHINNDGSRRRYPSEDGSHGHVLPPSAYQARVDPETLSYFSEVFSLIGEGGSIVDPTERATLAANILEETRGKELPLACHPGCSRLLESLLSCCDIIHTLSFLSNCVSDLPLISVDPSGSHVIQAAIKSISNALFHHGKDAVWFKTLETTLAKFCKAVGEQATDIMQSRYGSHVLRDILAILSGMPVDVFSKPVTNKSGSQLVGRLTMKSASKGSMQLKHEGFPELLKSLATRILKSSRNLVPQLSANSAAGPVLQATLKALAGEEELLKFAIASLLGCWKEKVTIEGMILEDVPAELITEMMKNRSSSHLVEVILETAPDPLFVEMFQRIFRHHLLPLSLHECANFAIQSLIASTRHQGQVNLILDELEESFEQLFEERRAGVVSSILAACGRFRTRRREVCRAIAHAVNNDLSSVNVLVPRLLFLEDYNSCKKAGSGWEPDFGRKMSVLGSAMLQMIFNFPQECNQQFSTSFAALEANQVLAIANDISGAHVLEAFILSSAPLKHKHKSIAKLKGHFAELATHPVSSFVVEKCFPASDINLKEAIMSELVTVHDELTRLKHGPYLLKRFDVSGYAKQPAQWKQKQSTKQNNREAFAELFGSENFAREGPESSTYGLEEANQPKPMRIKHEKQQIIAQKKKRKYESVEDGTLRPESFAAAESMQGQPPASAKGLRKQEISKQKSGPKGLDDNRNGLSHAAFPTRTYGSGERKKAKKLRH